MISKRYGESEFNSYTSKREVVRAKAKQYDELAVQGDLQVIYNFGAGIINDSEITITDKSVSLGGFEHSVALDLDNPYKDMVN